MPYNNNKYDFILYLHIKSFKDYFSIKLLYLGNSTIVQINDFLNVVGFQFITNCKTGFK